MPTSISRVVLPPVSYDFLDTSTTHTVARANPPDAPQIAPPSVKLLARGHHGLQQLQNDLGVNQALNDIFERHLHQIAVSGSHEPAHADDVREARLLRVSIAELMHQDSLRKANNSHLRAACQDVLSALDLTISRLAHPELNAAAADRVQAYYESPHRYEPGFFDALKKRFLGTSDLDEAPHAVVGAKAGISEIINPDQSGPHGGNAGAQSRAPKEHPDTAGASESPSRLNEFQMHSVPHSAGELATDMALSGVLGIAGLMAASAGRGERLEAGFEKTGATDLKDVLEEEKRLLQAQLAETATQHSFPFSADLLKRELSIVNWQLESVNHTLAHVGKKKQVGVGSELAGWQMMLKSVIDSICKPLAFSGSGGAHVAEAAASVTGFATSALSPGAAVSGLWMGVNAKRLFHAERKEWKALLETAVRQSGLRPDSMPEDIREDFARVFNDGKWHARTERLQSVNKLLNWFVGGMSGYTGAMTGISIHNLVQLAIAGSIIAELSMSGGIITATGMVLIGTLAFLKHHARFHEYEHWLEDGHPVVDLDLFRELAASGGGNIGRHAVDTLRFYEGKENRRQNFLHELARLHGLNYDGLRLHSTDSETIKAARRKQIEASRRNASQRFLDIAARGRKCASYLAHSGEQLAKPAEWRSAFMKARNGVRDTAAAGDANLHGHHHHHRHGERDTHNHGGMGKLTSGIKVVTDPIKAGARIAGKTMANTLEPAAQKARQTYANHTDRLTKTRLAELLLSQTGTELVREYMKAEAEAHAQFAQARLQTAMEVYSSECDHAEEGGEVPAGLRGRFRKKGLRLARDQAHVKQAGQMLDAIDALEKTHGTVEPSMLGNMAHLQYWSKPSAQASLEQDGANAFANYLWKGAHEDFRKSRLCLTAGVLKLAPLLDSMQERRTAETASPAAEPGRQAFSTAGARQGEWNILNGWTIGGHPAHFGKPAFADAGLPGNPS